MCGIAGIFHFDSLRKVNINHLKKMTDILRYRGPDNEGFFIDNNVGLGHRRLSIIDLSSGDQPMFNDDKSIVLILNGEIYNYIELREELKNLGHNFRTTSDTEIIIKAYEQWGVNCQNKFNGMWAFALWDERKKHLFLSRDRIGEKPLHYAVWDNSFLFGSEIKSLFEYGLTKEPKLEFLEIYSVFENIPAPYTFFKNINKLMPGHYLIINSSGFNEYQYWDLPEIDEDNMLNNKKLIYNEFTSLFQDSVKIRMRSDVPFGAFLSGGLDSSSIVSIMAEISNYPVKTFTIAYDEKEFDESKLAGLVAQKFKTEHFVEKICQDTFNESFERVVFHYDEPFGDSSAIPTGYVSKFASEYVKMVLTGDGGDEVLSGYPSYQGVKFAQIYSRVPRFIKKTIPYGLGLIDKFSSGSIGYNLKRYQHLFNSSSKDFNTRLIDKRAKPDLDSIKSIINPDIKTWSVTDYLNEFMGKCPYKNDFYKLMYMNFKYDLPNDFLVKVDRMSMAYSLETRIPFLDHRIIEFMIKVDKNIKMEGWERKSILKNTLAKKLPRQLLNTSKKGFRVPVREWFKSNELKTKLNRIGKEKIFNVVKFDKIVNDNSEGLYDHGNLLWSLTVLDKVLAN